MNIFENYYYRLKNYLQLRKYKKMHRQAKIFAIASHIAKQGIKPVDDSKPVPKNYGKIEKQADQFKKEKLKG